MGARSHPQQHGAGFFDFFDGGGIGKYLTDAKRSERSLIKKHQTLSNSIEDWTKEYEKHIANLAKLDEFMHTGDSLQTIFKDILVKNYFRKYGTAIDSTIPLFLDNYTANKDSTPNDFKREHIEKQIWYVLRTEFGAVDAGLIKYISGRILSDDNVQIVIRTVENKLHERTVKHSKLNLSLSEVRAALDAIIKGAKTDMGFDLSDMKTPPRLGEQIISGNPATSSTSSGGTAGTGTSASASIPVAPSMSAASAIAAFTSGSASSIGTTIPTATAKTAATAPNPFSGINSDFKAFMKAANVAIPKKNNHDDTLYMSKLNKKPNNTPSSSGIPIVPISKPGAAAAVTGLPKKEAAFSNKPYNSYMGLDINKAYKIEQKQERKWENKDTRDGKDGARDGKDGARDGKDGARDGKDGARDNKGRLLQPDNGSKLKMTDVKENKRPDMNAKAVNTAVADMFPAMAGIGIQSKQQQQQQQQKQPQTQSAQVAGIKETRFTPQQQNSMYTKTLSGPNKSPVVCLSFKSRDECVRHNMCYFDDKRNWCRVKT
jgi:hypothetical protein